ncbi:hypothetical protein MPTK1_8g05110 [Marchantia polymorpha subsp. ruderalis]|uniref:F-box domain-containing protein n=1 Tax=Marchantia polymorpha TaxID=3197 RepID=A0A2R6WKD7_MARPO|nr:hypothetical protein MARPO_0081s0012 [Marchantia polymorpha]BBN18743.1 hypothetical protein Mp_8g05110 [Marchantia polymorpha subsp. ruderalis]|eukprot:PTQ34281.1 hypothetical protein MARPO_0081s0012 [Marchantia polymorpha]
MDRVSTWFDRNQRLSGYPDAVRVTGRESSQALTSAITHARPWSVLLSCYERGVAPPSSTPPHASGGSWRRLNREIPDPDLDSALWSQLPESIVLLILACLPIQSLAKCRLVCKKWCSLWNDPQFLSIRGHHGPKERSWFIYNCQHVTLRSSFVHTICFNPALNRWHSLKLASMADSPCTSSVAVATSGGLVLCASYNTNSFSFSGNGQIVQTLRAWATFTASSSSKTSINWFVCNPLRANSWIKLPPRPRRVGLEDRIQLELIGIMRGSQHLSSDRPTFTSAGLIADTATGSFTVVLATPLTTEVFDSRTGRWKLLVRSLLPHQHAYANTRTISYQGLLLSVGVSKLRINNSACSVVFFEPENEVWRELKLPGFLSPNKILSIQLESCDGRLMLLVLMGPWTNAWSSTSVSYNAATPNPLDFEDSRLCVWELVGDDLGAGAWREVCSHLLQEVRDLAANVQAEAGAKLLAATSCRDLICCTLTDPILSQSVQLLYSPFYNTWFSVEDRFADEHLFCSITDFPEPNIRFHPRLEASACVTPSAARV